MTILHSFSHVARTQVGMLARASFWCGLLLGMFPSLVPGEENWTEFRGPNGTGIAASARPPVRWSETENVAWKVPIHGRGWSSPVLERGKIWLTTATEDGREQFVVCVRAEDGQILFDRLLFTNESPSQIDVTNSYASCTVAADGDRVYVHFGSYGTACLNAETGETLWQRRDFPCEHYRGPGSSPIVHGNLMIVHFDGFDFQYLVALNKLTGETVWKKDRPDLYGTDNGDVKKAYGTPAIYEIDGRQQLVSPYAKTTMAYDPATGEELWWVRYEQHSTANRPLFDGERVFIGTGFGKGSLLAVNPHQARGDVTDTHVPWVVSRSMPSKPSPLLIEGRVYTIADKIGIVSCVNAETGDLLWQERLGGTFTASPVYAAGRIYFCDEDGKSFVVTPGDTLQIVAENQLEAGCMATPAPVGDSLYLRTRTHLYRLKENPSVSAD
ncbi:MAG: PQQ-like beta-propeller repeat protein [Planctomycetaceae bacterium]|nr:PQQ-like beta-propeller repeat protein [Planctomycetaceae bacterium]